MVPQCWWPANRTIKWLFLLVVMTVRRGSVPRIFGASEEWATQSACGRVAPRFAQAMPDKLDGALRDANALALAQISERRVDIEPVHEVARRPTSIAMRIAELLLVLRLLALLGEFGLETIEGAHRNANLLLLSHERFTLPAALIVKRRLA